MAGKDTKDTRQPFQDDAVQMAKKCKPSGAGAVRDAGIGVSHLRGGARRGRCDPGSAGKFSWADPGFFTRYREAFGTGAFENTDCVQTAAKAACPMWMPSKSHANGGGIEGDLHFFDKVPLKSKDWNSREPGSRIRTRLNFHRMEYRIRSRI